MATALPALFAGADVLVLCELMSGPRSRQLLAALRPAWPHQSGTIQTWGRVCGGVRVLSKHPIRREATHLYEATEGITSDRLAAKGVVGVELDVPGAPGGSVYIFGSHMHAPETASGQAVRLAQAAELRRFMGEQGIPAERLVLLAGDFNLDMDTCDARAALRVHAPTWVVGDATHTVDEATNVLVGMDGSCRRGDGSCRARILDGVYASTGYARHAHVTAMVIAARDGEGRDLSDHHAVDARVTW